MEDIFMCAASTLSETVWNQLEQVPERIQKTATEIRLRTGRPLTIHTLTDTVFVLSCGGVTYQMRPGVYIVSEEDVQKSFRKICGYSVHSYQNEIKNGFLTVNGNRIGFCGTAVTEDNEITAVRKISSINVRIARQITGAADDIISLFHQEGLSGVLIAGAPSTGKTTLLKDLVRQLADGSYGQYIRVSVIDERGEIGGEYGCGKTADRKNDLGCSSDLFTGYPKGKGMELAIRTMAPEVIVCDEIGNREDAIAIQTAVNSGVIMIATMHAADFHEFQRKPFARELLKTGAFRYLAFLENGGEKCKISRMIDTRELSANMAKQEEAADAQAFGTSFRNNGVISDGNHAFIEFIKASQSS